MKLENHLLKRGFAKKTASCSCRDRYFRAYGYYSVRVWQFKAFMGDRKAGQRKGLGSEIEVFLKGVLQETLDLHPSARQFDEWLKSKGFLNQNISVGQIG